MSERKPGYAQEVMLRVSWSVLNHDDGQPQHVRRGEVMLDLGLESAPEPPFTRDEMQLVAYAAKMAALKALRTRSNPKRAPIPYPVGGRTFSRRVNRTGIKRNARSKETK